jgi:hypothetical protein
MPEAMLLLMLDEKAASVMLMLLRSTAGSSCTRHWLMLLVLKPSTEKATSAPSATRHR